MMEFLAQGGFAFYVWSCYGMAVLLIAAEFIALRKRRRTILARLGRLNRMRDAEEQA
ncbi:MAG: heme exporter protein CcmD [Gammaproteobacteria bacterium]|jgi:heme exporter protein D|nr:heme exporter protein CcmD [Gammaproteobacteria bacterium]